MIFRPTHPEMSPVVWANRGVSLRKSYATYLRCVSQHWLCLKLRVASTVLTTFDINGKSGQDDSLRENTPRS